MARTAAGKESSIINYFQNAPVGEANLVFGIVRGVVKSRQGEAMELSAPITKKPRKSTATGAKRGRKPKAAPVQAGEALPVAAILGEEKAEAA